MKNNIDYYFRDARSYLHPKFKALRRSFSSYVEGWAAEGRFWALNDIIASSEDCRINLNIARNKACYADELGMNEKEFDDFIALLTSEKINLLKKLDENIYTTNRVIEVYRQIMHERMRNQKKYYKSKNENLLQDVLEVNDILPQKNSDDENLPQKNPDNENSPRKNPVSPRKNPVSPRKIDTDKIRSDKIRLEERENNNDAHDFKNKIFEDEIQRLWIRTWGRNPTIPEHEETEKLIKKFGVENVHKIFREATLKNFKSLYTLINSIDENGNIKPREAENKLSIEDVIAKRG